MITYQDNSNKKNNEILSVTNKNVIHKSLEDIYVGRDVVKRKLFSIDDDWFNPFVKQYGSLSEK